MADATHLYAIAIGSNRPHGQYGRPPQVVEAAIAKLDEEFGLFDASPIILNAAIGGAGRDFANAVVLVESDLDPPEILRRIKTVERQFGRRRGKPLGAASPRPRHRLVERWAFPVAVVDHSTLRPRRRAFVLQPLAAIAPKWRVRGALTARHLALRLARRAARG